MKLALIYDKEDRKLTEASYSQCYRNQWLALINEFEEVQHIHSSCSAKDIEADVIIFYDVHSCHHLKIDGIEKHPAIKYEYLNDPHQIEWVGVYTTTGQKFFKLGAGGRSQRIYDRGIDFVICPNKEQYYRFLGPYLPEAEKMLVYFPLTSIVEKYNPLLIDRKGVALANGCTWSYPWFPCYDFRKWAFEQKEVEFVRHYVKEKSTPHGKDYLRFLSGYAGALALCSKYVCPKYLEIPAAGCLCFAQDIDEYRELGFKDGVSCILVTKKNFSKTINDFKNNIQDYQHIASTGRSLVENNYTAAHFARFIRRHIEGNLKQKEKGFRILSPKLRHG